MLSNAMASPNPRWEDLRRQARQLENELDLKLVSFSKLGTTYTSQHNTKNESSDQVPLLSGTSTSHMFQTMSMEIEQLLAKLTELNDKLADYMSSNGATSNPALLHTLQRHRDILQDYSHEFSKTKTNVAAQIEREDLLGSVHRDIESYKSATGLNRRTDLYLKEQEHIRSSDRLVEEQISIAMATKDSLEKQKRTFHDITNKLNAMANKFPLVNSLIQRVNFRKRRDSIILDSFSSRLTTNNRLTISCSASLPDVLDELVVRLIALPLVAQSAAFDVDDNTLVVAPQFLRCMINMSKKREVE